ncbi:unnamed protein product, partial [Heterosigma akashiwo]
VVGKRPVPLRLRHGVHQGLRSSDQGVQDLPHGAGHGEGLRSAGALPGGWPAVPGLRRPRLRAGAGRLGPR